MKPDLFQIALKADERYSRVITTQFPGKDRWTLTKAEAQHPEVLSAYEAKVSADAAWLAFLRGEPEKPQGLTLDEAKEHLSSRAKEGAFGLSWDEIEKSQGGKLTRLK